jgi:hypothetical protein
MKVWAKDQESFEQREHELAERKCEQQRQKAAEKVESAAKEAAVSQE